MKKLICKIKGHNTDYDALQYMGVYMCKRCGLQEHESDKDFTKHGLLPKIHYWHFRFWCKWDALKSWYRYNIKWKYFHTDDDLPF